MYYASIYVCMYVCVRERGKNGGKDNIIKTFCGCFAEMFYKHDYKVQRKCFMQMLQKCF